MCEQNLQGKKLKCDIDSYHYLTPGITKQIKSKPSNDDNDDDKGKSPELDDRSTCVKVDFRYLRFLIMKNTKVKLLGMIQRINYMKLNTKMMTKKNVTIMKFMLI